MKFTNIPITLHAAILSLLTCFRHRNKNKIKENRKRFVHIRYFVNIM